MRAPRSTQARRVEVRHSADDLARGDYASAFEVSIADSDARSPQQWARDSFEGAPPALRWFVVFGWKHVLGFRLGPHPSPDHVQGWKIMSAGPDAIILEVQSRMMTARKVLRIEDSLVVMTTFVRYQRSPARALWTSLAPVHHRTEPYLLGHAAMRPPSPERNSGR